MGGQELGRNFLQDLRFGFRMSAPPAQDLHPSVLPPYLGIGANAAVFSWIEGILSVLTPP